MSLSDVASIIMIADFVQRLLVRLRNKKTTKKTRRRKKTYSQKRDRELELTKKLLENPIDALKEMGAEYVVSNRRRILRKLEDYVIQEIQGEDY